MDCVWVNLKNVGPRFSNLCRQFTSKCHLHSSNIIRSCFVAVILQMKDSYSANLTFKPHNVGIIPTP